MLTVLGKKKGGRIFLKYRYHLHKLTNNGMFGQLPSTFHIFQNQQSESRTRSGTMETEVNIILFINFLLIYLAVFI